MKFLKKKTNKLSKKSNIQNSLFREIIGRGMRLKKDISEGKEYRKKIPRMTNQELATEIEKYLNEKRKHKNIGGN